MITLTESERADLKNYLTNALANPQQVVSTHYTLDGTTSGTTLGTKNNNRPLKNGEEHNCTSWLCTLNMGESHLRFYELVGGSRLDDVHTNAGWWNYTLLNDSPRSRVPLAILWTDDMANTAQQIRTQGHLNWNFQKK